MAYRKTIYSDNKKGKKHMIISDSREKENQHILDYFDRHEIRWVKRKLDTGDYMMEENPNVRIERKQSLAEMAHNMLTADRPRFYREVRRARDQGIRLVILCEHGGIHDLKDVEKWKPQFGKCSGKRLADAIFRLELGYSVPTFFCDPRSAGRRILEILTEGDGSVAEGPGPGGGDNPETGIGL